MSGVMSESSTSVKQVTSQPSVELSQATDQEWAKCDRALRPDQSEDQNNNVGPIIVVLDYSTGKTPHATNPQTNFKITFETTEPTTNMEQSKDTSKWSTNESSCMIDSSDKQDVRFSGVVTTEDFDVIESETWPDSSGTLSYNSFATLDSTSQEADRLRHLAVDISQSLKELEQQYALMVDLKEPLDYITNLSMENGLVTADESERNIIFESKPDNIEQREWIENLTERLCAGAGVVTPQTEHELTPEEYTNFVRKIVADVVDKFYNNRPRDPDVDLLVRVLPVMSRNVKTLAFPIVEAVIRPTVKHREHGQMHSQSSTTFEPKVEKRVKEVDSQDTLETTKSIPSDSSPRETRKSSPISSRRLRLTKAEREKVLLFENKERAQVVSSDHIPSWLSSISSPHTSDREVLTGLKSTPSWNLIPPPYNKKRSSRWARQPRRPPTPIPSSPLPQHDKQFGSSPVSNKECDIEWYAKGVKSSQEDMMKRPTQQSPLSSSEEMKYENVSDTQQFPFTSLSTAFSSDGSSTSESGESTEISEEMSSEERKYIDKDRKSELSAQKLTVHDVGSPSESDRSSEIMTSVSAEERKILDNDRKSELLAKRLAREEEEPMAEAIYYDSDNDELLDIERKRGQIKYYDSDYDSELLDIERERVRADFYEFDGSLNEDEPLEQDQTQWSDWFREDDYEQDQMSASQSTQQIGAESDEELGFIDMDQFGGLHGGVLDPELADRWRLAQMQAQKVVAESREQLPPEEDLQETQFETFEEETVESEVDDGPSLPDEDQLQDVPIESIVSPDEDQLQEESQLKTFDKCSTKVAVTPPVSPQPLVAGPAGSDYALPELRSAAPQEAVGKSDKGGYSILEPSQRQPEVGIVKIPVEQESMIPSTSPHKRYLPPRYLEEWRISDYKQRPMIIVPSTKPTSEVSTGKSPSELTREIDEKMQLPEEKSSPTKKTPLIRLSKIPTPTRLSSAQKPEESPYLAKSPEMRKAKDSQIRPVYDHVEPSEAKEQSSDYMMAPEWSDVKGVKSDRIRPYSTIVDVDAPTPPASPTIVENAAAYKAKAGKDTQPRKFDAVTGQELQEVSPRKAVEPTTKESDVHTAETVQIGNVRGLKAVVIEQAIPQKMKDIAVPVRNAIQTVTQEYKGRSRLRLEYEQNGIKFDIQTIDGQNKKTQMTDLSVEDGELDQSCSVDVSQTTTKGEKISQVGHNRNGKASLLNVIEDIKKGVVKDGKILADRPASHVTHIPTVQQQRPWKRPY